MKSNYVDEVWDLEESDLKTKKTRKTIFEAIGVILCIILFAIGLGIYGVFQLVGSACGNEVVSEISQPGGTYKAVVFIRDCGATTRQSYQVSIVRRGSSIDNSDTGNVFITYSPLSISWSQNNNLIIDYGGGTVFKQERRYKGIIINYK